MGQNHDVVSRFWSAFESGDLDATTELMTMPLRLSPTNR